MEVLVWASGSLRRQIYRVLKAPKRNKQKQNKQTVENSRQLRTWQAGVLLDSEPQAPGLKIESFLVALKRVLGLGLYRYCIRHIQGPLKFKRVIRTIAYTPERGLYRRIYR